MAAAAVPAPEVEEKTEFDVVLTEFGSNKLGVIKRREITGLGLKDAKGLSSQYPSPLRKAYQGS